MKERKQNQADRDSIPHPVGPSSNLPSLSQSFTVQPTTHTILMNECTDLIQSDAPNHRNHLKKGGRGMSPHAAPQ